MDEQVLEAEYQKAFENLDYVGCGAVAAELSKNAHLTGLRRVFALGSQNNIAAARRERDLEKLLAQWTKWKPGLGIQPPIKPGHGPCCTCQICGRHHDDCVCEHNEIEEALANTGATP